jgi:hypothetical protein
MSHTARLLKQLNEAREEVRRLKRQLPDAKKQDRTDEQQIALPL